MTSKHNKVFQALGHECEMLAEENEIEAKYPGNSICAKLRRQIMKCLLVSETFCQSCTIIHLRSHGAIVKEKRRQLDHHPFAIHPFSPLRIAWECYMIFICVVQLITVPIDVSYALLPNTFPLISSNGWKLFRNVIDLNCCLNILITAFTGYYAESIKVVVLTHRKILKNYLKTTFILDLLSSVPTHFGLYVWYEADSTVALVLRGLSLFKALQYYTFTAYVKKFANIFNVNFYWRQGILLFISILLYWHMTSAAHAYGWSWSKHMAEQREKDQMRNLSALRVFAQNMYTGALLISTCSYGAIAPKSNLEKIVVNLCWFTSKFLQIFFLARIIEFLKAATSPKQKYTQMVKQLIEFMRHKQLPPYTQKRILKYYEFHFQKSYFRENDIYATISGQLRQEIVMQTCRQLVENVAFFRDLPLNLLIRIVSCLQSEIYLTNDVVVRANTAGNAMYFISTGTVAVYTTSGKEVCHLEDGAHFGEIALVMKDELRVASVVAVEVCELYRLDRKDFVKAIHPYPDLLDKIQRIAADRMEKTTMLDEHNKREIAARRFY